MPQYQVEALRTIRVIQRTHEKAGHTVQAEQMRKVGDQVEAMQAELAALEARHNALREAVEWEREFDEVLVWLVQSGRYPRDMAGKYDLANERECARAEVDRLIANERGDK